MVYRIRITRNHASKEFYTLFGKGFTSKREARKSVERMKPIFGVEHYRIVKRKTKGNLRNVRHKFPLSRYKTQAQQGTSWKNGRRRRRKRR